MLDSVLMFLACLLSVYGAYSLISCLIDAIRIRSAAGPFKIRVIVAVRDAEDQIEFVVRNAVKEEVSSRLMSGGNITFVDMGSQDGTLVMLRKLKKEYESIDILEVDDRDRAFHL